MNMIVVFENEKVLELYNADIRECVSKYKFSKHILEKYRLRITQLISAPNLQAISQIKSLNLEKLKDNRQGQLSIRVDNQFRICFVQHSGNEITIKILELTDYHK